MQAVCRPTLLWISGGKSTEKIDSSKSTITFQKNVVWVE